MKKEVKQWVGRGLQVAGAAGTAVALTGSALADGTDVTTIVTAASSVFTAVATLCVTIGTFMIGYRLARKVR
jgi:hypothetical protein